jgi:predicted RNase H-like HicB family nuclease
MSESANLMEINTLAESQTANLKVNILLETREDGSAIASVLELPQYHVEAATREQALLMLKELLVQRMDKVEVIPMEIQLPQTQQSQKPWMKFAGVFKDDPDFDAVQQYIQEYRQELDFIKPFFNPRNSC